jgi:hypothetical protein
MYRVLGLALFASALLFRGAWGADDATSLAQTVAKQLREALPGYQATVVDPLTIQLRKSSKPTDPSMQINLDRVASYCAGTPEGCHNEVSDFIAKMVPVVRAQDFAPEVTALRAVVRPADYLAQLAITMRGKGPELVSGPFAGDLVMMCYFDMPTAMRPAFTSDLARIALSKERALSVCIANMRAALPRLSTALQSSAGSGAAKTGYLKGDPYTSSYLLLHDDWQPLADRFGGHLLVAAPATDLILYGPDNGHVSSDAMFAQARDAYAHAERSISQNVFRWTRSGWEVAAP